MSNHICMVDETRETADLTNKFFFSRLVDGKMNQFELNAGGGERKMVWPPKAGNIVIVQDMILIWIATKTRSILHGYFNAN